MIECADCGVALGIAFGIGFAVGLITEHLIQRIGKEHCVSLKEGKKK